MGRVTLRPHPTGPTLYDLTLRNMSQRAWDVKASVRLLSAAQRERLGRQFDAFEKVVIVESRLHTEQVLQVLPGATVSWPLFPPGPAAKSPEGGGTPPPPATPAPAAAIDVSGGLLCLLEHAGQRQALWLDVLPQHPAAYVQPEVDYDSGNQRLSIQITASDLRRLPTGTCSARWEVPPGWQVREAQTHRESDLHTGRPLQLEGRLTFDPSAQRFIPVVLTVDGYPRAFAFEQRALGKSRPQTQRLNAQVALYEVDDKGLPKRDPAGNLVELPPDAAFAKLDRVGVLFRADVPSGENQAYDYQLRVYINTGGAVNTAEGEFKAFSRDRQFSVALDKPTTGPGFRLLSRVEELNAVLNTSAFRNQRLIIRGEILEERPREGGKSRIIKKDETSVIHDDIPPRVLGAGSNKVTQGDPLIWEVDDDLSGIKELLYDLDREFRKPELLPKEPGSKVRATFRLDTAKHKPDKYEFHLAAVDRAGNKGTPQAFPVEILPKPEPPAASATMPKAVLKRIVGTVVYEGRPEEKIAVVLTGPKGGQTTTDDKGLFRFEDLPEGVYQLEAKGVARGVRVTSPSEPVDLRVPETTVKITIRVKG
jgi:hypothetical protein